MRWTVTIKGQTYGVHTEISKYECRVAGSGGDIRPSVQNAKLLACAADGQRIDIVFAGAEAKAKW